MEIKINIPEEVNELIHILQNNGHSAYVVGGCVRDSILGRIPHDWDVCTSATPNEMLEIFKDKRIIETGLKHGTITIVSSGKPIEITTYRIDGEYSDNRRPSYVTFTSNLLEDLSRRDFTINSMAYNNEEGLIDPFDGLCDIQNKVIRCVGSPKDRFNEDALRILRAIRFAAKLEFSMTKEVDSAIHQLKDNLNNISIERINSEFCKIAFTDMFSTELFLYYDVFSIFIPELKDIKDFQYNNFGDKDCYVFNNIIKSLDKCDSEDLIIKLTVFFRDFGKPHSYQMYFKEHNAIGAEIVNKIMRRLKFDNDTREKVIELVYYHEDPIEPNKKNIKIWLNKIGIEQFKCLLKIKITDYKSQNTICSKKKLKQIYIIENIFNEILNNNECYSLKDLAVNGDDLIKIGYKPGKELGKTINKLLNLVIDDELKNDRILLLQTAEMWLVEK